MDLSSLIQWYQSTGISQLYNNSSFGQWVTFVAQTILGSPFFKQFGLLVMFIWEASPTLFIPIPLILFMLPLVYAGVNQIDILAVALAGSVIGDLLFYYLAKYSVLHIGKKAEEEIDESHFLHQHRWLMFIAAPIFYLTGDAIMLYAGAKQMPVHKFIIPMFIGNAIRITFDLFIATGIIHIGTAITA